MTDSKGFLAWADAIFPCICGVLLGVYLILIGDNGLVGIGVASLGAFMTGFRTARMLSLLQSQ